MCRSIHVLREGREIASEDDIRAAARQFVRKVSGFSKPTAKHEAAFEAAVLEITGSTQRLLDAVTAALQGANPPRG